MVNGEVVMSKVNKIIVPGSATDKKQQEHLLWYVHQLDKKNL